MAPPSVPQVKYLIGRLKRSEVVELAEATLGLEHGAEVLARFEAYTRGVAPSLFEAT